MKKYALLFFALLLAVNVCAQYSSVGYYRIQNKKTERYITVIDNKGSVDLASTTADLGAVETIKYFKKVVSNPASVIYIAPEGDGYDLKCQGTSTYSIISYYIKIRDNKDGTYKAYAEHSGLVKYLCDENTSYDEGLVLTNSTVARDWYIEPVSLADGTYFGLTPEITIGNDHYLSFYASFPFSLASTGMTAYYIDKAERKMAVCKEVTDGVVPAATPVIIKCSSTSTANNKLDLLTSTEAKVSGNLLRGVYFKNTTKRHNNVVANDTATVRVLGKTSTGSLGFVKSDADFLSANTAYLTVPAGSPAEFKFVNEEQYIAGVNGVEANQVEKPTGTYSLLGVRMDNDNNQQQSATKGIYIKNGKVVLQRK